MTGLDVAYQTEVYAFRQAQASMDIARAWQHLERAHILSQSVLRIHLHAHLLMLAFAIARRDWLETWGQIFRMLLAPLGAVSGRIPFGNTGRVAVSAFMPMPVPQDLQRVLHAEPSK